MSPTKAYDLSGGLELKSVYRDDPNYEGAHLLNCPTCNELVMVFHRSGCVWCPTCCSVSEIKERATNDAA